MPGDEIKEIFVNILDFCHQGFIFNIVNIKIPQLAESPISPTSNPQVCVCAVSDPDVWV